MPGEGVERIFLYGTLRRGASRDATIFYDGAKFDAMARVRGRLHDFGEYPGLRLDEASGWVVGEIFEVTPDALAALDEWEGISPDDPDEGEYRRVMAEVERDDGASLQCWLYEVSSRRCADAPVIASGDWLARS